MAVTGIEPGLAGVQPTVQPHTITAIGCSAHREAIFITFRHKIYILHRSIEGIATEGWL